MVIAALLILGVSWFAVAAVSRSPVASLEREVITAQSLHAAKQALLAYAAQYAARVDTPTYDGLPVTSSFPGRMPCPESLNSIGGANDGLASSACGNVAAVAGRLPWRTLGVEPLTDGDGERLWYVLSPNFHPIAFPPTSPALNFDTPAALPFTELGAGAASNVVALIIAPGKSLNTNADPGTPPAGCAKVGQTVNRYVPSLDPAKFFECGNATGNYANLGRTQWTNDIAITQAEWANAIAPAIGDRLQREVAPAIRGWDALEAARTGRSWGTTYSGYNLGYLPFASDWGDPTLTNYCGNQQTPSSGTVRPRGLMPIDPSCYNNPWTVNSVVPGGLLNIFGGGTGCTNMGSYVRCQLQRIVGLGAATADITLTANNVGRAFRSTIVPADLTISNGGGATVTGGSMPNTTSDASLTFRVTWPGVLALLQVVSVDIPHLQNAQIHSDSRITWYWNHGWHRYTWYAVADDATVSNTDPSWHCDSPGGPGCLNVQDLPAASGNTNDKWLVLVLSGPPLAGQTRPSANVADYFERQNGSIGVFYQMRPDGGFAFNDRVATCPFRYQDHVGANVQLCN
jgi:hypothetical protein